MTMEPDVDIYDTVRKAILTEPIGARSKLEMLGMSAVVEEQLRDLAKAVGAIAYIEDGFLVFQRVAVLQPVND